MIASIASVAVYYLAWVFYYCGNADPWVILLLTLPPWAAFILFAMERKNIPAFVFAICFTVCHLFYGIVNFIK